MGYKIEYHKAAEKYLDNQPLGTKKRIKSAIENLPDGDVKKMTGREGYRLMVGGFRILFIYLNNTTIEVVAIGPRGDIYKK